MMLVQRRLKRRRHFDTRDDDADDLQEKSEKSVNSDRRLEKPGDILKE
jgi:hypothetical protein